MAVPTLAPGLLTSGQRQQGHRHLAAVTPDSPALLSASSLDPEPRDRIGSAAPVLKAGSLGASWPLTTAAAVDMRLSCPVRQAWHGVQWGREPEVEPSPGAAGSE